MPSQENYSAPNQIKASFTSPKQIFFMEIYRNIQTFASILQFFQNAVLGRLEMLQSKCFFLAPTKSMFAGKFVQ